MADEEASCGCAAITKEPILNYYRVFVLLIFANSYLFEFVAASSALYQSYEGDGGGVDVKFTTADKLFVQNSPKSSAIIKIDDHISTRTLNYDESSLSRNSPKLNSFATMSTLPMSVTTDVLDKTSLFSSILSDKSTTRTSVMSSQQMYSSVLEENTTSSAEQTISLYSQSVLPSSSVCISILTISGLCDNASSSLITNFASSSSVLWTSKASLLSSILSSVKDTTFSTIVLQSSIVSPSINTAFPTAMHSSFVSELSTMSQQPSSIHSQIEISSSSIILQSAYIINPAKKVRKCEMIARNFSKAMSNYTECILSNLMPMRVCYNCLNDFTNLKEHHRNIYHNCEKEFITSLNSRYQVITQLFDFQKRTWGTLECESKHYYFPRLSFHYGRA